MFDARQEAIRLTLDDVLQKGGASAWVMGRRFLSEETLMWASGANYAPADGAGSIIEFVNHWRSNDDYEITIDSAFEGKAGAAVRPDKEMDAVRITLCQVNSSADVAPGNVSLYVELLRHAADWIERNAETVMSRQDGDIYLGDTPVRSMTVTLSQEVYSPVVTLSTEIAVSKEHVAALAELNRERAIARNLIVSTNDNLMTTEELRAEFDERTDELRSELLERFAYAALPF